MTAPRRHTRWGASRSPRKWVRRAADRRRRDGRDPEGVRRAPGLRAAGRFDQRLHRRAAPRRRGRLGARPPRGGRGVRGRRRGGDDRAARRLRRQLRPGNLHLINGLFDANRSRVPVLAIAAHIPREEIGGSYFQETHPQELFRECSVYAELVSVPEQLPRVLEIAMRHATRTRRRGRRGHPRRDLPAPTRAATSARP